MIARIERVAAAAAEKELDLLLVGDLVRPGDSARADMANLRWMTGFGGTSGAGLIGPGKAIFVTDFRYAKRARMELEGLEIEEAERLVVPALAKLMAGRVGFDDAHTSVRVFTQLQEVVDDSVELVPSAGVVEDLRRRKDDAELARIREAGRVADEAHERALEGGLAGRTEIEVAAASAAAIRELGGEPSFAAIVAAGPNGAEPHAEPSEREIGAGELVVFDFGAELDGYCSDCTRTAAAGEPGADAREIYELVRRAQAAGMTAAVPGAPCKDVDSAAREIIAEAGHGDEFGHGLGHGVGVEVHEAPRLGQRSDDVLVARDVVTVEPGVYLSGRLGVRIEDMGIVTDEGYETMAGLPKELRVVD